MCDGPHPDTLGTGTLEYQLDHMVSRKETPVSCPRVVRGRGFWYLSWSLSGTTQSHGHF